MTIQELLNAGTKSLKQSKSTPASRRLGRGFFDASRGGSPALDAEVLLSYVLKKPKEFLYTNPDYKIRKRLLDSFEKLIEQRTKGVPMAYLTGEKEFFGLKFYVNKNVLIPRPETETLVELVLKYTKNTQISRSRKTRRATLKILDIGTGSGCIIISMAKTLKTSATTRIQYFASDESLGALKVARKNAKLHKVKITFKQGDLLKPWKNQQFDIIVANLPYLRKLIDPSTQFEPKIALIAKKKGLVIIERFFEDVARSFMSSSLGPINRHTTIFLEFDPSQTTKIKKTGQKISARI